METRTAQASMNCRRRWVFSDRRFIMSTIRAWCPPARSRRVCFHIATYQLGLEIPFAASVSYARSLSADALLRPSLNRRGRRHRAEQPADIGGRKRPPEQIALDLVDARFARDQGKLLIGFDALDGDAQAEFRAQSRHAAQQRHVPRVRQVLNERLVDLYFVQREAVQIAETRITRPEVVE